METGMATATAMVIPDLHDAKGVNMSISMQCQCGSKFSAPDDADGQPVACPRCHAMIRVPSVADELVDLLEKDQRKWIHVACGCGFIVKGPRSWAGRKGRCPNCGVRIGLSLAAELRMPEPVAIFTAAGAEDAHFSPTVESASGTWETDMEPVASVGTEPVCEEDDLPGEEFDAAKELRRGKTSSGDARTDETSGIERLRAYVNRTHRRLANVGVAALLAATVAVWTPLASGAPLLSWASKLSDRFFAGATQPTMSLEAAVKAGNVAEVKINLIRGADTTTSDVNGLGTLSTACVRGDRDAVALLIEHGANMNESDKFGATPLHWAAGSGRLEVVEYLVAHGADVNAVDGRGVTPMDEASAFGHRAVVELLQENHATARVAVRDSE
jgi:hypothetical protein